MHSHTLIVESEEAGLRLDKFLSLRLSVFSRSRLTQWIKEGFVRVDINRAVEAGLTFRPMAQTVQDSLAWYRTLDDGSALKAGLTAQREAELLEKWHLSKTN